MKEKTQAITYSQELECAFAPNQCVLTGLLTLSLKQLATMATRVTFTQFHV